MRIEHSGAILVVDPRGHLYALFTPPLAPHNMAQDLIAIQHAYS